MLLHLIVGIKAVVVLIVELEAGKGRYQLEKMFCEEFIPIAGMNLKN
jgi:hypothetical protein